MKAEVLIAHLVVSVLSYFFLLPSSIHPAR